MIHKKIRLAIFFICGVFVISNGSITSAANDTYLLTVHELNGGLSKAPNLAQKGFTLIDVRARKAHSMGFIPVNALNIDFREIGAWHDEIGAALERWDWFVVVLSPASVKSRWVKQELLFALNDARYEDRIVPVIHRPCRYRDLSWTLPSFQMIDFTQK